MADNATGWRNAADELPPEGVPVAALQGNGGAAIMASARVDGPDSDDDLLGWAIVYNRVWHNQAEWCCEAEWDDMYDILYWHPLPDVPTLAELAAATAAAKGAGR